MSKEQAVRRARKLAEIIDSPTFDPSGAAWGHVSGVMRAIMKDLAEPNDELTATRAIIEDLLDLLDEHDIPLGEALWKKLDEAGLPRLAEHDAPAIIDGLAMRDIAKDEIVEVPIQELAAIKRNSLRPAQVADAPRPKQDPIFSGPLGDILDAHPAKPGPGPSMAFLVHHPTEPVPIQELAAIERNGARPRAPSQEANRGGAGIDALVDPITEEQYTDAVRKIGLLAFGDREKMPGGSVKMMADELADLLRDMALGGK